ncbi:MAG: hypothetical protein ACETWK_11100 [Candidatus Aminicenantaceae bacterium]
MLKRYQVLLPDWLEYYIKLNVEKYDLSFSEIIRSEVCFPILSSVTYQHPEYKLGITPEKILELAKKNAQIGLDRDKVHRIMSKIHFETMKAVEYRLSKEKKLKKSKA